MSYLDFGRGSLRETVRITTFSVEIEINNLHVVSGSLSWRIPLAVQIIPGAILGVGCVFLPPSPRLLIFQGKEEEALQALAKIRRRNVIEAKTDPLIRVCIQLENQFLIACNVKCGHD